MWEVIRNPNFKLNDPDSGPPYYVCKGETCYPAYTEEEAKELCKNLNHNPHSIVNKTFLSFIFNGLFSC